MRQDEEMIRGTVQTVVYQNPENGYAVLRLHTEDGQQITVVGTVPMTVPGERLIVTGKWGYHASHGRQFEAEFLERLMPETGHEIFSYLASGAVKGIGEKQRRRSCGCLASVRWRCSKATPSSSARSPAFPAARRWRSARASAVRRVSADSLNF